MATQSFDEMLIIENDEEVANLIKAFELADAEEVLPLDESNCPNLSRIKEIYHL